MKRMAVEIIATRGSAPRDAGTVMWVRARDTQGTIGGGALEHHAIAKARHLMLEGIITHEEMHALGPNLGQCCGGSVHLRYGPTLRSADAPQPIAIDPVLLPARPLGKLWIWGAGHVGRAVVSCLAPTKAFGITWIDSAADRFPQVIPQNVEPLPTAEMPRLAAHAPKDAYHLIFTYSHDIDLALCAALLRRGFSFCGLIGSKTKWQRFQKRLREHALDPSAITCPIGDPLRGKHPDQIAHSTATQLLRFGTQVTDTVPTEFLAS